MIYDDRMMFKRRRWFKIFEITITYNHVAQANLTKGVFFATIEIINSGGYENASLKNIPNKDATKAKKMIDQKIRLVHTKDKGFTIADDKKVQKLEKSLNRLMELLRKKRINKREFNKRKKILLRKIS